MVDRKSLNWIYFQTFAKEVDTVIAKVLFRMKFDNAIVDVFAEILLILAPEGCCAKEGLIY